MYRGLLVKVVIPARDEALSITQVVHALLSLECLEGNNVIDEVLVADNGSTDATAELASLAGARVVSEPEAGYGRACLKALSEIGECDVVLFCDGDHAFYAEQSLALLDEIKKGADLAIGSRVLGEVEHKALTPPQAFGNELASFLVSSIWGQKITDLGPYRAIRKGSLDYLNMQDETFGWTVEMQIKAIQYGMTVSEVPVDTKRRIGHSKISGTLRGTIGAGVGILSMIARLWWSEYKLGRHKHRWVKRDI